MASTATPCGSRPRAVDARGHVPDRLFGPPLWRDFRWIPVSVRSGKDDRHKPWQAAAPVSHHRHGLGTEREDLGVGGDQDDMARLFSYDPATGAYQILGFVDVNRRPYYTWQAYVIGAMVTGLDGTIYIRSEEHTSELQSRLHLVCRLLLEKKKKKKR